jgi:hypothetical protein
MSYTTAFNSSNLSSTTNPLARLPFITIETYIIYVHVRSIIKKFLSTSIPRSLISLVGANCILPYLCASMRVASSSSLRVAPSSLVGTKQSQRYKYKLLCMNQTQLTDAEFNSIDIQDCE